MIVVGAGGLAKELLEIFHENNHLNGLCFYDDVYKNKEEFLYKQYPILRNPKEAANYILNTSKEFTIGIGNPQIRHLMYEKFIALSGIYMSAISPKALIGSFDVEVGDGANILANAILSNSVTIGIGALIYYNVIVTHDCVLGDFVELSPGATILGGAKVGSFTQIGANATILPKVEVGKNCVIGAGAVVTCDVKDNCLAVGVPAKTVKYLSKYEF